MAAVTIIPAGLAGGVASEDVVVGAVSGHTLNPGDTFTIPAAFNDDELFVISPQGAATFSLNNGDNPPSPQNHRGGPVVPGSLANGQVRLLVPRKAQYVMADGTISGRIDGATCVLSVYRLPAGFIGFNGLLREAGVA